MVYPLVTVGSFMFSSIAFIVLWWMIDEYANGDRKLIVCLLATIGVCLSVAFVGWRLSYLPTREQRQRAAAELAAEPNFDILEIHRKTKLTAAALRCSVK